MQLYSHVIYSCIDKQHSLTDIFEDFVSLGLHRAYLLLQELHLVLVLLLHGVQAALSFLQLVHQLLLEVDLCAKEGREGVEGGRGAVEEEEGKRGDEVERIKRNVMSGKERRCKGGERGEEQEGKRGGEERRRGEMRTE